MNGKILGRRTICITCVWMKITTSSDLEVFWDYLQQQTWPLPTKVMGQWTQGNNYRWVSFLNLFLFDIDQNGTLVPTFNGTNLHARMSCMSSAGH